MGTKLNNEMRDSEDGNIQAERRGDGSNCYCVCMGNETRGTVQTRGVTEGEGRAWVVDA